MTNTNMTNTTAIPDPTWDDLRAALTALIEVVEATLRGMEERGEVER